MNNSFWDRVETVAKGLGATDDAYRQWQHRKRVPSSWHLLLLQNAPKFGVEFAISEFLPKQRKKRKASVKTG